MAAASVATVGIAARLRRVGLVVVAELADWRLALVVQVQQVQKFLLLLEVRQVQVVVVVLAVVRVSRFLSPFIVTAQAVVVDGLTESQVQAH